MVFMCICNSSGKTRGLLGESFDVWDPNEVGTGFTRLDFQLKRYHHLSCFHPELAANGWICPVCETSVG